jgi:hypothetical protein
MEGICEYIEYHYNSVIVSVLHATLLKFYFSSFHSQHVSAIVSHHQVYLLFLLSIFMDCVTLLAFGLHCL